MGLIFPPPPLLCRGTAPGLKSSRAGLLWLGFGGIAAVRSAILSFSNFLFSFHHRVQD